MNHYSKWILFILSVFVFSACSTKQYFTVDSANYQPAVFDESSRTTTIEVVVSDIDTNVVFTDMVFRNLRIPVYVDTISTNKVKVTGYIQIGGKLADDQYQIMTEEPNKLYFDVGNSRRSIRLENIQRQKTELP